MIHEPRRSESVGADQEERRQQMAWENEETRASTKRREREMGVVDSSSEEATAPQPGEFEKMGKLFSQRRKG